VTYLGMRRHPALAWLALALLLGGVEIYILSVPSTSLAKMAAITLLVPLAYLCVGQSVRAMTGQLHQYRLLVGTVLALTGMSLLLLVLDAAFLYQTLPFQLAAALAVGESIVRLRRNFGRSLLDTCLILTLALIVLSFLVRTPLYLAFFDASTPYETIRVWGLEKLLLAVSGLLTPPAVFMLMAKVIGGVIATYRMRSEHDGLTGLLNRQTFDLTAEAESKRGGAVIFCDIDHFKQINDVFGHQSGDEVIREFATLLMQTGFPAGRIGGEEFAILMAGATIRQAEAVADAVRLRFAESSLSGLPADLRLSASFGISRYRPGEPPRNAFVRADAALYRAKQAGRNRVMVDEDEPVAPLPSPARAA
jgi:diguanylate cyclase (GGDEF)-like protein